MNPMAIKLGLVALDQINLWMTIYAKAKDNPAMTEAEAEALIAQAKTDALRISDDWRQYRANT